MMLLFVSVLASVAPCLVAGLAFERHEQQGALSAAIQHEAIAERSIFGRADSCRCYPGDSCWPSESQWQAFNRTIDGRLVATTPLASPCHNDKFERFDNNECKKLQDGWLEPQTHYDDSSSIMAPFFANRSCDPFLPRGRRCILGTYVQYAVSVKTQKHVRKTIQFVKKHNIRLVIRNTGHDYNGKSTGAGGLAIWTHHLKDISFGNWKTNYYTGKTIKMGAGVQGIEAYQAAHAKNLRVVGGECPTVGLAGGYTQGGGHSALASKYGLGADQALEWEVIDGNGKYYKANREQNSDLFWALSGGGGGTFGVVMSLTSKAHPDNTVSGFNLTFTNKGISQDTYYKGVSAFHSALSPIVDAGAMSVWYFTNTSFTISPITGPDLSVQQLRKLMQPFLGSLKKLGIKYTSYSAEFPSYLDQFNGMQAPIQVGIAQYGGRLIPRSVVENNNENLTAAYRHINEAGGQFIGVGVNVSRALVGDVYNAVNPPWRKTLIDTVITTPWNFTAPLSEMVANQRKMTNDFIPRLEALSPGSGAYLNEADFLQPKFQDAFYGKNYKKLLSIKRKYDPDQIFWATTAVGSEYWQQQQDGRLCKVTPSYAPG